MFSGGREIYAIIETGGKQYKVALGQVIDVERLDVDEGNTVELDKVLAVGDGADVQIGVPTVEGAKVLATAQGQGRGKKIIVFRFKAKVRYRRKQGHRQGYTRLTIDSIVGPGIAAAETPAKGGQDDKEVTESGT